MAPEKEMALKGGPLLNECQTGGPWWLTITAIAVEKKKPNSLIGFPGVSFQIVVQLITVNFGILDTKRLENH